MTDMQGGTAADVGAVTNQATDRATDRATEQPGADAALSGDTGAGQVEALQPTEEDIAHRAEIARQAMIERAKLQQAATETFTMIAWFAHAAALSLRYAYQDETQLAASVAAIGEWHGRAINALAALGQITNDPAAVPTRDALHQELGQLRAVAQAHLRDLGAYANSHADIIDAMPEDFAALLAIGRSLAESYNAASGTLLGIGMVTRARAAAQ